ncbi:MAG: ATP-binding protein [Dehalococcoidia bacterium]
MVDERPWPPEFSLDKARILKLLTGDRFYSNASASLREAVLNALDATHRRHSADPQHEPLIKVVFSRDDHVFEVSDNGDGMTRATVTDLFTRIGASAAEFDPHGKGEVGEFGIGVISYFMAADSFEIETASGSEAAIGLRFHKDMFISGGAAEFSPARTEQGTTLRLFVRNSETFELLEEQFPHWCREVHGLSAVEGPDGKPVPQGGDPLVNAPVIDVSLPPGIEAARIGPVSTESGWGVMTGSASVAVLYRGVFVQDFAKDGCWGLRGSLHVDPKAFPPRLNREGFVGDDFQNRISAFLDHCHPPVLRALAALLEIAFNENRMSEWSVKRFATMWLSVPREDRYKDAAAKWDGVFRRFPAFEVFGSGQWRPAAVEDLIKLSGPIWVASQRHESRTNDLIKSAERLLRETGAPVVRGLTREKSWLQGAGNYFATTADLIARVFAGELPELRRIDQHAETVLSGVRPVQVVYGGAEPVELARLGSDGPPVLRVGTRLLINIDAANGLQIARYVLDANRGRGALLEATALHAAAYLSQVSKVARLEQPNAELLGLVKRRHLRELVG